MLISPQRGGSLTGCFRVLLLFSGFWSSSGHPLGSLCFLLSCGWRILDGSGHSVFCPFAWAPPKIRNVHLPPCHLDFCFLLTWRWPLCFLLFDEIHSGRSKVLWPSQVWGGSDILLRVSTVFNFCILLSVFCFLLSAFCFLLSAF